LCWEKKNMMKAIRIPVFAFLPLLIVFASGCTHNPASNPNSTCRADITGLEESVAIAVSALHDLYPSKDKDYTLTSAQQIIVKGKYIWLITFKPTELWPKDPSKGQIGMGGEVFVNVDLSTKKTQITYGE